MQPADNEQVVYARVTPRLRATIGDMAVRAAIIVLMALAMSVPERAAIVRVAFPLGLLAFLLYEPVLITLRGATVGDRLMNLRVVRAGTLGRVSLPRALLRTVIRAVAGVDGFLAMYATKRHQALHDLLASTVVIPGDAPIAQADWFVPARTAASDVRLPSRARRMLVIIGHWLVLAMLMLMAMLFVLLLTADGQPGGVARIVRQGLLWGLGLVWSFGAITFALAGWHGWLWGAQRRAGATDLS